MLLQCHPGQSDNPPSFGPSGLLRHAAESFMNDHIVSSTFWVHIVRLTRPMDNNRMKRGIHA